MGHQLLGLVLINSTLSVPHEGRTERRVIGRLELPWREVDGESYAGPAWFGRPDPHSPGAMVARSWWADEETVENLYLARENDEPGTSFLIVGAHDVAGLAASSSDPDDGFIGDEESDEDTRDINTMHARLVEALGRDFWAAMTGGGSKLPSWRSLSEPFETARRSWRSSRWTRLSNSLRGPVP